MSNDRLKLRETPFSKGSPTIFYMKMVLTQQVRHLWVASDTTISLHIIMCQSDAQFGPLLSQKKSYNANSTQCSQAVTHPSTD